MLINRNETKASLKRLAAGVVGLGSIAVLMSACVVEPPRGPVVRERVVVEEPGPIVVRQPPPPRYEPLPRPPNEHVVWDQGHWHWDGRDFVWIPGHYVERPYREAVWEPGHWGERNGGWVWVEGRWQGR